MQSININSNNKETKLGNIRNYINKFDSDFVYLIDIRTDFSNKFSRFYEKLFDGQNLNYSKNLYSF